MEKEKESKKEKYVRQSYTERNPLTGLYFNRAFFEKADEFLKEIPSGSYMLVAVDIKNFRLFNRFYGRGAGDRLLVDVAEAVKKAETLHGGFSGYLGGDNFCIILPDNMEYIDELEKAIVKGLQSYNNSVGFYPVFGIYQIIDKNEAAVVMHDRATIAISRTAGTYSMHICRYSMNMEERFEEELKLLAEIQTALENEEFTFYAQPQCDISTGKIVGAESLVRWIHGEKGMISPGVFIPVLEENGLIDKLDRYVWKKVCEWLRSWIDRGYHPVPISINVSRIDISAMDVPGYLKKLIREYGISEKLLKVEITESAYAENSEEIISAVKELRDAGFVVMMDDFGSGYSSLNMLKNVSVDVLKLDMRFLDIGEAEEKKGIGIIESVVNMARMMGLPIIVEGVETQKQENFLMKIGCQYIQGFYYYRPLPISQFEELLSDERRLDFGGLWCKQVENMHVREFLNDNLFDDEMVNNILGAMAFYEVYQNQIEITRVNEQYYQMTGVSVEEGKASHAKLWNHVRDDDKMQLLSIFEQAYKSEDKRAHGNMHFVRTDGKVLFVHFSVFFMREREGRRLYYGSLVDISSTRKKKKPLGLTEMEFTELSDKQYHRMEKYYGAMPYGYAVGMLMSDDMGRPKDYKIVYINHEMAGLCGGNIGRLRALLTLAFENKRELLLELAYNAAYLGKKEDYFVYSPVSNRYLQFTFYQYEYGYVGCILRDVTHMHIYEKALDSIMLAYREVYFVHLQDNYCRMIYPDENSMLERGNYEELINRHFGTGKILSDDEYKVRQFLSVENLRNELMDKDTIEYRYRRSSAENAVEGCVTTFTVSERENGVPKSAIITIRSIESILREEEAYKRKNMAEAMANMSDGFFVYRVDDEEKILYANPKVLEIYGCNTMEEFRELVNSSFKGMVHKDDLNRVECEIQEQIQESENNMDYIRYRIIRKDGEVRWIDDCGHMEETGSGEDTKLFYVFISDITDTITTQEKERLLDKSRYY